MNAREFYKYQCDKQTDAGSFNTQKQKFSLFDLLLFAELYFQHQLEERINELKTQNHDQEKKD